MPLPDKNFFKKFLIWLLALSFLIIAANFTYLFLRDLKKDNEITALSEQFLSFIGDGDIEAAREIWPAVYTVKKSDPEFLNTFSDVLYLVYVKYYSDTYHNGLYDDGMYETCRIFHSFLNTDKFNEVASSVLNDYLNEIITYKSFIAAQNDLFLFSMYSSALIPNLLDRGVLLNNSRNIYYKAEETAGLKDYTKAIELMRMVSPYDTVYYPKSINKIDKYILLLTEEVKNGS